MRKILLFSSLLLTGFMFGQNALNAYPENNSEIPVVELPSFDHTALLREDTEREKQGNRSNHGRVIPYQLDFLAVGNWTTLSNGDRVCQLRFNTNEAKAVCAYFDNLWLPEGTTLTLFGQSRDHFVGPYTAEDCSVHGRFRTAGIWGEEAVLEYYQPASVVGLPTISIRGFGHFYRFVDELKPVEEERGGSEACEVDVNCPEGDPWVDHKNAVVRLEITEGNFVGLCTGSLVNTTAMDCRRYILTAMHCAVNVTDADFLDLVVRFNYERSGCGAGSAPSSRQKTGVFHLADSNDNGGDNGSDFLLVEMEDEIPASWNPFFAGWNASTSAPSSAICMHHPSGDSKKISTTQEIVSGTWGAAGHHWRVEWMETATNWGVTEGGSSGSPLYNSMGQCVGTLTGGGSFCDNPTSDDFYGKMDRHWDDNPNTASQKLKVWLDPDATTVETSMLGSYMDPNLALPCSAITSLNEELSFADIQMFPTIANDYLQVVTNDFRIIKEVRIFDATGKIVGSSTLNDRTSRIDIKGLQSGMYYISFIQNDSVHVTKKFTVSK
jgi:V8-like Glu-specific endopeptidase